MLLIIYFVGLHILYLCKIVLLLLHFFFSFKAALAAQKESFVMGLKDVMEVFPVLV